MEITSYLAVWNKEELLNPVYCLNKEDKDNRKCPLTWASMTHINKTRARTMKNDNEEILKYKRKSVFTELKAFDVFASEGAFIEVTQWRNREGFNVEIQANPGAHFRMTYGQFDALKALVKKLNSVPDGV